MTNFIPGKELSRLYYVEVVKPLLDSNYPTLQYSAALMGKGSDVLGYDTERSMDHDWGPRLKLFLQENEYQVLKEELSEYFAQKLPTSFLGFSTNYKDNDGDPTQSMAATDSPPIRHKIEIIYPQMFFYEWLGIYPDEELTNEDWLTFPQQRLLEITKGEVFYDGLNSLNEYRNKFSYFPDAVWRYMLAVQWMRIAELEPLVGRCIELKDVLGFRLLVARIVELEVELCFMMECKYIPYAKWVGTAFQELKCSETLSLIYMNTLAATEVEECEKWLVKSYEIIVEMHNNLQLTEAMPTTAVFFHDRPYVIIGADIIAKVLWKTLSGTSLSKIKYRSGAIDQMNLSECDAEFARGLKEILVL